MFIKDILFRKVNVIIVIISCISIILMGFIPESTETSKYSNNKLTNSSLSEEINLENTDLSNLESGMEIEIGDLTIKYYSNMEAAKEIAKDSEQSEFEILNRLNEYGSTIQNKSGKTCSTGAIVFSRKLEVGSLYRPTLNVWTMLCQNSSNQFVVDKIVDITLDRAHSFLLKGFSGSTNAQSLNNGKTLYMKVEGSFYNNPSTTTTSRTGVNSNNLSVIYKATDTSNYYKNIHFVENLVLFQ